MSSGASPSPADRLVTACLNGDLPSAAAAVADGASVNQNGRAPDWGGTALPLRAALLSEHLHVVVWLLSHGADPNGDSVMQYSVTRSSAAILQLLIDAGGDINRGSSLVPLWSGRYIKEGNVWVLLALPSLDLTVTDAGKTLERYARDCYQHITADMIALEVRGRSCACVVHHWCGAEHCCG